MLRSLCGALAKRAPSVSLQASRRLLASAAATPPPDADLRHFLPSAATAPTNEDIRHVGVKIKPGQRVLLHSCCAPCSGAMIRELQEQGIDLTIYFYNPNIHPRKEYEIRKQENIRFAKKLEIDFVDADYEVDEWYKRARGMEFDPERGGRCSMCFDMRMDHTVKYAAQHGFDYFTTTNATSRWKCQTQVNDSGHQAAEKYPGGPEYLMYDWQSERMTQRKYKINAEESFYKQEYCGCSFSLRDSNMDRKARGVDPIKIGGGGNYSDPVADSEEESLKVVAAFFEETHSEQWKDKMDVYKNRRKNAKSKRSDKNNW